MTRQDDAGQRDLDIEFRTPARQTVQSAHRPQGELVGTIPADAVEVYIDRGAIEAAWEHVLTNRRTELGGVLIGHCAEDKGLFTHVIKSLDARYTETTVGSLTFTHDTWKDISERMDSQYPDAKIVGWYHSHPGHGIFMSGRDKFIHNNFFRNNWQCALVLDPIHNDEGLFQLVNGQIVRTGYWCAPNRPTKATPQKPGPTLVVLPPNDLEKAADHFHEAAEHLGSGMDKLINYGVDRVRHAKDQLGRRFDKKA
ncbi:MAG: hypothetical protein ACOX3G_01870 [Armatimonadota bacterium]|jgi:proteasome lid subunit RPN8/RPN11